MQKSPLTGVVVPPAPVPSSQFHTDLLNKCATEYRAASDYVREKRGQLRQRLLLYNNQRKQREKVAITSIYTTLNTLLAIYYTDELSVGIGGRGFSGTDRAENLENVAKADQEEMDMATMNYLTQWDRFFFGVGIRHIHGWNGERSCPLVESKDPLTWLPDPTGGLRAEDFRFMGFEEEMAFADMTAERGFFNLDHIGDNQKQNDETRTTLQARRNAQGLTHVENLTNGDANDTSIPVVNWFTVIDGKRFLTTWCNDFSLLVRCEEIKAVFKDEQDNSMNCPWGITLHYYSPERNNPFGTSVCDLMEDKQRAKSVLANLEIAKEKADLYPMYVYNRDKILNRRDLDFAFNKFIGVRGDVQNTVLPLIKDQNRFGNTENLKQVLDRESALATGADAMQSGVMSKDSRTLGEVQQVQANSNIRFILGSRVNGWAEVAFWKLWYRCYVEFFDEAEEKVIEVCNPFGIQTLILTPKQFLVRERVPKIVIKSKTETEQKMATERSAFLAVAPLILQDASRPQVSRRFTERHLLKLHGLSKEMVSVMSPPTVDEMAAQQENELLSRDVLAKVTDNDDHLSHIVVHSAAADTSAKKAHVEAHRKAYILSGQQERDRLAATQAAAAMQPQAAMGQAIAGNQNSKQAAKQPAAPKQEQTGNNNQ